MTSPTYTHISILCDQSGSMATILKDSQGGFDQFLADQRALPERATVSIYEFDSRVRRTAHFVDINDERASTRFAAHGATALNDAIHQALTDANSVILGAPLAWQPTTKILLVISDGEENSSQVLKHQADREIAVAKERGWKIIFFGCDGIANEMARDQGFQVQQYDRMHVGKGYGQLSNTVSVVRGFAA